MAKGYVRRYLRCMRGQERKGRMEGTGRGGSRGRKKGMGKDEGEW